MCFPKAGIKPNRLPVSENRLGRAIQPRQRERTMSIAASVRGLQSKGLAVVLQRLFGSSFEHMDFSQVVPSLAQVRVHRESLPERRLGRSSLTLQRLELAEPEHR